MIFQFTLSSWISPFWEVQPPYWMGFSQSRLPQLDRVKLHSQSKLHLQIWGSDRQEEQKGVKPWAHCLPSLTPCFGNKALAWFWRRRSHLVSHLQWSSTVLLDVPVIPLKFSVPIFLIVFPQCPARTCLVPGL